MKTGFRKRLVLFLILMLVGIQVATAIMVYHLARGNLIDEGKRRLAEETDIFARQLTLIGQRIGDGVEVLAHDFPLRSAISRGDRDTVLSTLRNHVRRIDASRMFVIGLDGAIVIDTLLPDGGAEIFPAPEMLAQALRSDRADALAVIGTTACWAVVVAVRAPTPVGFVGACVPIDDDALNNLKKITATRADIALSTTAFGEQWRLVAQSGGIGSSVSSIGGGGQSMLLEKMAVMKAENGEYLALNVPLQTPTSSAPIIAEFKYSIEHALQRVRSLVVPVLAVLVLALAIALAGVLVISRGVSRPLEKLARGARKIGRGDCAVNLEIRQNDEIGALSEALMKMATAIRERQEALQEIMCDLEIARDEAVQANQAKSQFLANMSHELRTPLNAIIGFAGIINEEVRGGRGDARFEEYSRLILESGRHLLGIIESLLDLAKVEAGSLQISREYIDPGTPIRASVDQFRPAAAAAAVALEIDDNFADLPWVWGDSAKLERVCGIVVDNAVKFTPSGGRVTVSACFADAAIKIVVSDTGIGMAREELARIMQPFHRVNAARNSKYEGVGIGLPLAKALMSLHDGALEIESEPGVGTTVVIALPVAVSGKVVQEVAQEVA